MLSSRFFSILLILKNKPYTTMNLKYAEMQQALKISNAIQNYFKIYYDKKEVRSIDMYEYLSRSDIIERDRHGGIYFREFLKKLKEEGFLSLIPQCRWTTSLSGNNEWYFVRMSDEKLNEIRNKYADKRAYLLHLAKMKKEDIDPLVEIEKPNIERLPKRDTSELTSEQFETRKTYPRAYEYWSKKEIAIMKKVFSATHNINKVAGLLQRQPHTVKAKLEGLVGL